MGEFALMTITRTTRSALALTASLVLLGGCSFMYPDPEPPERDRKELHFDPEYYSANAKEYFSDGHYAKAKDQWLKQLKLEDNWMARLGVASCDYHMGSMSLDLGDLRGGRASLQRAEAAVRDLWDGTIEADTAMVANEPVRQWQAALILAITHRALSDCDNMEARILAQRLGSMSPTDERRNEVIEALRKLEKQRDENRKAAMALLAKLNKADHPSQKAVLHYAEMLALDGRHEEAEAKFVEYLKIARDTHANLKKQRADTAQMPGSENRRAFILQQYDRKLVSNEEKQVAVLVRLGNIHFDDGSSDLKIATDPTKPQNVRDANRISAKKHFAAALGYLRDAQALRPSELHILVKMAQCEGELGFYEDAILNLDRYITLCAERRLQVDENIHQAYRMKSDFKRKLDDRTKDGK